jgi:hypothetical protein
MSRSRLLLLGLIGLGVLLAAPPAAGQRPSDPVTVIVPENYPAFAHRTPPEGIHPAELYAVVLFDNPAVAAGNGHAPIILLNPEHLDARTLRAALVAVHNHRARGTPAEDEKFAALGSEHAAPPVPAWATEMYAEKLTELTGRRIGDVPRLGRGRSTSITDPSSYVRRAGRR